MNDTSPCSLLFLANCGFLLTYKGHKIMIDGLYNCPPDTDTFQSGISRLPKDIFSSITDNREPFSDIDLMLFTHTHWDHCNLESAKDRHRKYGSTLYYPEKGFEDLRLDSDSIRIETILCPHDVYSNPDLKEHCIYRITVEDKGFLFTGDMDISQVDPRVYERPVDYLFFNVHHLLVPGGRALVNEKIKPHHLFVQHLPFPEDDCFKMNRRIHNKIHVFPDQFPPYTLLDKPMMKIL